MRPITIDERLPPASSSSKVPFDARTQSKPAVATIRAPAEACRRYSIGRHARAWRIEALRQAAAREPLASAAQGGGGE